MKTLLLSFLVLVIFTMISGCGGGGEGSAVVGSIAGVVKSDSGAAIAGATVTTDGGRSTTTNSAGQFKFANLLPGVYTLTASKTGFVAATGSVAVAAGAESTFEFTLGATTPGTGRIDGVVYDSDAKLLSGVSITTSGGRATFSDATGKFSFKDLPGGRYTLTAAKVGFETKEQSVTVLPGESAVPTIVLIDL